MRMLACCAVLAAVVACSCSDGADSAADAAPSNASYRAVSLATALDRVAILRSDPDADLCALLRLASPAGGGSFGVTTPANWDVDLAGVSQGAADCLSDGAWTPEVFAVSGTGEVNFTVPTGELFPTALSVDATIEIDTAAAPAWAPASVTFRATDLAVE